MKCKDCKFWDGNTTTYVSPVPGFCRRFPPLADRPGNTEVEKSDHQNTYDIACGDAFAAYWPITMEHDWCGEFQPKEPEIPEIEKQVIGTLSLSIRSSNCLANAHIHTIGDLIKQSVKELLKIRGLGKTSLREIKRKLVDNNLFLKGDAE